MKVINPIGRKVSTELEANAAQPRACVCYSDSASSRGTITNVCWICHYNCNGTVANSDANHTKSKAKHTKS